MSFLCVRIEYICQVKADIEFIYETDFVLSDEGLYSSWLVRCASQHKATSLSLAYAFMSDDDLYKLNVKHLHHKTLTDIITFDDSVGTDIFANIGISVDRVRENAITHQVSFQVELLRVMAHGLLHCLGLNDKAPEERQLMRDAEDNCIQLFHVEQKPA